MDFKKIFTDSLTSSLRIFVSIIHGIAFMYLITNVLGSADYGIWTTSLAVINLAAAVGGLHMYGSLIRYSDGEKIQEKIVEVCSIVLLSSFTLSLTIYLFNYYFGIIPNVTTDIVKPIIALTLMYIFFELFANYPRALNNVKTYELYYIFKHVLELLVAGIIISHTNDIILGIWGIATVVAVINLILAINYFPFKNLSWPRWNSCKRHLVYGLPMVPKAASSRLLTHADKYIIIYLLSPSSTGIYAAAYGISAMLGRLTRPLDSTLYPSVITAWDQGEYNDLKKLYTEFTKLYVILSIPALFGLGFLAQPILEIISTEEISHQGWYLIPVLGIGFIAKGYLGPCKYIINAEEENHKLALITIFVVLINVGLNFILIPIIGIIGAAIATAISYMALSVYILTYVKNRIEFKFPYMIAFKSLISSVLMLVFLHNFIRLNNSIIALFSNILTGVTVYLIFMMLAGGISIKYIKNIGDNFS